MAGKSVAFLGLWAKVPANRWTGEPPDPAYIVQLARACKQSRNVDTDVPLARLLYSDVTGWAFTRAALERAVESNTGWSADQRAEATAILASLPPWPFEPTPTGWSKDGFPNNPF